MLQLYGPADPTGCGEGFSYVSVPLRSGQQDNGFSGSRKHPNVHEADLRKLNVHYAKNLLKKFGIPKHEVRFLDYYF